MNPRGKTLLNLQSDLVFKPQERKKTQVIDKYLDPMISKEQRTKGLKESKPVENLSKGPVEILLQEPNENSFQELRFDGSMPQRNVSLISSKVHSKIREENTTLSI